MFIHSFSKENQAIIQDFINNNLKDFTDLIKAGIEYSEKMYPTIPDNLVIDHTKIENIEYSFDSLREIIDKKLTILQRNELKEAYNDYSNGFIFNLDDEEIDYIFDAYLGYELRCKNIKSWWEVPYHLAEYFRDQNAVILEENKKIFWGCLNDRGTESYSKEIINVCIKLGLLVIDYDL